MPDPTVTGAILIAGGLYSASAAIGELVRPGHWQQVIDGFAANRALAFVAGLLLLVTGVIIAVAHPMDLSAGWKAILANVVGYAMLLEGLIFIAFPNWLVDMSKMMVADENRTVALVSLLIGGLLIAFGIPLLTA